MKINTHNYYITVKCTNDVGIDYRSVFCIKAIPVNEKQALEIAKVLFPDNDIEIISFVNQIVPNEN